MLKVWALGGSYDLGVAKLYADYVNAKADSVPATGVLKMTELNAGVRVPFGAATFIAGVGRNKDTFAGFSESGTAATRVRVDGYRQGACRNSPPCVR